MELFPVGNKSTPRERVALVDNILAVYDRATPEQQARGMAWYRTAHDLALMIGDGDATVGAGVLAALSANTGWAQNLRLATDLASGIEVRGLPTSLNKARRILGRENPAVALGAGRKTQNFYRNIAWPELSGPVTVDRHAHDVARNQVFGKTDRGLSTPSRYETFANAYRAAANARGIRPHEMQAVTWVVWTEEIAGTSTRGARRDS